jgi:death on curing protein
MRYLTIDELVYINEQLVSTEKIHTIVEGKRSVRDMGLLEAAAARPQQTVFGEDAYPTPQEKAAALLHSMARNHPFADGNKRTAAVAALFLLEINGLRVNWRAEEALEKIVALAEGKLDPAAFTGWLPVEPTTPTPEPDAARDMLTIARIIADHHRLLTELAAR